MTKRYYIDVMDHDDGHKSFHVCDGGQAVAIVSEDLFDDISSARATSEIVRDALNEHSDRRNGKLNANAITTYEQIQAIHEAMLECERSMRDSDSGMDAPVSPLDALRCFAKIRAALAGETKEGE